MTNYWMAVTGGLPPEGEAVLGWSSEGELPSIFNHVFKCLVIQGAIKAYCDCGAPIDRKIDYWMPYPAAPAPNSEGAFQI